MRWGWRTSQWHTVIVHPHWRECKAWSPHRGVLEAGRHVSISGNRYILSRTSTLIQSCDEFGIISVTTKCSRGDSLSAHSCSILAPFSRPDWESREICLKPLGSLGFHYKEEYFWGFRLLIKGTFISNLILINLVIYTYILVIILVIYTYNQYL